MAFNAARDADHQTGESTTYSPRRRAAKALVGLVLATGVAVAADTPGGTASPSEGATEKQIFSQKLPNVPGKTLTVVQVDYRPGGFSAPHRHPASGFVFADDGVQATVYDK
jgi:hypothetical protein